MAKRWYYKDANGNKVPVPQYKIDADDYYTKAMSDSRYYEKSATDTLLDSKVSKSDVAQSTGASTTSVMSQNAVSDAIKKKLNITDFNTFKEYVTNGIEAFATDVSQALETKSDKTELNAYAKLSDTGQTILANKLKADDLILKGFSLNDLIDVMNNNIDRNTSYIGNVDLQKVDKTDITQSTGTSETAVMSQKASTDSFIANTPSGDPMHNVYVEVGAVWNAKTGFWELNGLTDITNEQMLTIYVETNNFLMYQSNMAACYCFSKCRTNIPNTPYLSSIGRLRSGWIDFFRQSGNIEVVVFKTIYSFKFKPDTLNGVFLGCVNLRLIDGILDVSKCTKINSNDFVNCSKLESVKLYQLNYSISLKDCKMLSSESVQYMIENALDATITITLHPEAYERAIADAGVQTALTNKTNVSLAKGE